MKTISVVQRLSENADEFADWLTKAGYRVKVCTGPNAPRYACWSRDLKDCPYWGQSDLMIYDPWLQEGPASYSSIDMLRTEHARHPDTPILLWGPGAAVPKRIAAMEETGKIEFLPLEISPDELIATVERLIGPPGEPITDEVEAAAVAS